VEDLIARLRDASPDLRLVSDEEWDLNVVDVIDKGRRATYGASQRVDMLGAEGRYRDAGAPVRRSRS
jgi:hypothetical protein